MFSTIGNTSIFKNYQSGNSTCSFKRTAMTVDEDTFTKEIKESKKLFNNKNLLPEQIKFLKQLEEDNAEPNLCDDGPDSYYDDEDKPTPVSRTKWLTPLPKDALPKRYGKVNNTIENFLEPLNNEVLKFGETDDFGYKIMTKECENSLTISVKKLKDSPVLVVQVKDKDKIDRAEIAYEAFRSNGKSYPKGQVMVSSKNISDDFLSKHVGTCLNITIPKRSQVKEISIPKTRYPKKEFSEEEKIAFLKRAQEVGIQNASRENNCSCNTYYKFRREYINNKDVFKDANKKKYRQGRLLIPGVEDTAIAMIKENPNMSNNAISIKLKEEGVSISPPTVQNIRERNSLPPTPEKYQKGKSKNRPV